MRCWSLWSSIQYSCWMEHHCCSASGADVWVAAVVVVSQSHRESSCSTESAVCTATERLVKQCCCSTEERLSLENVLLAISFFGLA